MKMGGWKHVTGRFEEGSAVVKRLVDETILIYGSWHFPVY